MKTKLLALFTLGFALNAFSLELPQVQKPVELDVGEFAEGTMTSLSSDQIKELLPWANNAKKQLENGLIELSRMTLPHRLAFLQNRIKSVVHDSGAKKYQMLMRFALNRGLLMVDILDHQADKNDWGIIQNQLDILIAAVKESFKYYESDLEFQKRASSGNNVIVIPQAEFGLNLSKVFLKASTSIMDASAQYQVTKKIYEILNWDLSQDQNAKEYADDIIEMYKTLESLPKETKSDEEAIKHTRTLHHLKKKITILETGIVKRAVEVSPNKQEETVSYKEAYYDEKSGIYWTRKALEPEMNHDDAIFACKNLKMSGRSWRLPTEKEASNAEFNTVKEIYDNSAFWTSSVTSETSKYAMMVGGVNTNYYSKRVGSFYVDQRERLEKASVRCVSDKNQAQAQPVSPPVPSLYPIINKDPSRKPLTWGKSFDAVEYAKAKKLCVKGWRLPTYEEYEYAVNEEDLYNKRVDLKGPHWTSTTRDNMVRIVGGNAAFDHYHFTGDNYIRTVCVK